MSVSDALFMLGLGVLIILGVLALWVWPGKEE